MKAAALFMQQKKNQLRINLKSGKPKNASKQSFRRTGFGSKSKSKN